MEHRYQAKELSSNRTHLDLLPMTLIPKTWRWRCVWIGLGLLIIASAVATFTDQSPACTRDPCWRLGLRCVWMLINSSIVLGIGAIAATMFGYSVWRKEIPAREDHEASKVILRAQDRSLLAFEHLRSRGIRAWESAAGDSRVVFQNRYGRLVKCLAELETAIDEGVVLWGRSYRDRMGPVRECLVDLESTLDLMLKYRDSDDRQLKEQSVQAAQEFFGSGPQGDVIGKKLHAALQTIEDDARRRLIR